MKIKLNEKIVKTHFENCLIKLKSMNWQKVITFKNGKKIQIKQDIANILMKRIIGVSTLIVAIGIIGAVFVNQNNKDSRNYIHKYC